MINEIYFRFRGEQGGSIMCFQNPDSVSNIRSSDNNKCCREMRTMVVTSLFVSFLNVTEVGDRMRRCLGSLFHNDEYFMIKISAMVCLFGT